MSSESPYGPPHPVGPASRSRPAPVTTAGAVMLLGAAFGLVAGIAVLASAAQITRDFRRDAASSGATQRDIDALADGIQGGFVGTGIVLAVLALVVATLAVGVLRGNNGARIASFVLIFFSACCGVATSLGTLSAGLAHNTLRYGDIDEQTGRALGDALNDAVPAWLNAVGGGLPCIQLLGYIGVAVLLLLPASNAFFRERRLRVWQPGPPGPPGPPPGVPPSPPPGASG